MGLNRDDLGLLRIAILKTLKLPETTRDGIKAFSMLLDKLDEVEAKLIQDAEQVPADDAETPVSA